MSRADDRKKKLGELRANFTTIEEVGYELQSYGRHLAETGAKGKEVVTFLEGELEKHERLANDYPDIADALNQQTEWLNAGVGTSSEVVATITGAQAMAKNAYSIAVSSLATTTATGTSFVAGVYELQSKHPDVDFQTQYGLSQVDSLIQAVDTVALDHLLDKLDPAFSKARRGAWDAFFSSSEAKLEQASHLMREVLTKLTSKFASNDHVRQADWWVEASDTEGGVSTRQRLRFLMYGPAHVGDKMPELDAVETEVDYYMRSRGLLLGVAHLRPVESEKAVELALRNVERLLLIILERRESRGL